MATIAELEHELAVLKATIRETAARVHKAVDQYVDVVDEDYRGSRPREAQAQAEVWDAVEALNAIVPGDAPPDPEPAT